MKTTTFTKSRIISLAILVVIFVFLSLLPTITQGYWVTLMTDMLRYAILTVAWVIFCGPTNYMSLATATFFGLGFYVAAIFNGPLPFAVAIIIAGAVAFLAALAIGALTLRLRGVYFTMFTFAMVLLVSNVVARGRALGDRDARPFRRDRDRRGRVLRHVRSSDIDVADGRS